MAAASIGKLNVQLTATSDDLNRTIDQATAKVTSFGKTVETAGAAGPGGGGLTARLGALKAFLPAVTGAAVIGGVGALAKSIKDAADQADSLADAADSIGVTTEALLGLRLGAGAAADQFDAAFVKFQRAISEAAAGDKTMSAAFQRLNLNAQQLQAMRPELAWLEFVAALEKVPSVSDRISARMEILGRGSAAIGDRLAKGAEFWAEQLQSVSGQTTALQKAADAADALEQSSARIAAAWTLVKSDVAAAASSLFDAASAAADFAFNVARPPKLPPGALAFEQQRSRMTAQIEAERRAADADARRAQAERAGEARARQAEAAGEIARMRSPLEQAQDEMARVQRLFGRVPFHPDVLGRAMGGIAEKLIREAGLGGPRTDVGPPAGVEFGSAAHRREEIRMQRERELREMGPKDQGRLLEAAVGKLQRVEEQQKGIQQEMRDILRQRLQGVEARPIP